MSPKLPGRVITVKYIGKKDLDWNGTEPSDTAGIAKTTSVPFSDPGATAATELVVPRS